MKMDHPILSSKIIKFWSYLGFNDKIINERQILTLICLLGKEPNILIKPMDNLHDLILQILNLYINKFESAGFLHLTEYEIIQELYKVS